MVFERLILGKFISNELHDKETTGYTYRQPKKVNEHVNLLFEEVPWGNLKVILEHKASSNSHCIGNAHAIK
jgi:hypothetical protein